MPPALHLKPEDIDTTEKRSKYTVCVVGCGHKGIFYANAFARAGYQVVCTDANPSVTKKVTKGKTAGSEPQTEAQLRTHIFSGQICVSGNRKEALLQGDVIVIAIGVKVDEQKKIDYSPIISACKQVGLALHRGVLVVYGGVVGVGFIESTLKETLENTSGLKAGQDFGLAYNPILVTDLTADELTVAAADKVSLQAATTVLKTITKNVKAIGDIKTAEISTLFSITKRDANRALANELAVFCEKLNIDYFQVTKLLGQNDPSFSPSIIQAENDDEAYLLLDSAETLNVKLRLPALARQINEDMAKHAVSLIQDALRSCDRTLRRAKVAVLGPATQASQSALVKMLEVKGAKVSVYDPAAKKQEIESEGVKTSLNETVEGADCIVVLSGEEYFNHLNLKKLKAIMKSPSVIIDLVGKLEPEQVETEGFIYRGLGRETR